jgi:hypothetical protein
MSAPVLCGFTSIVPGSASLCGIFPGGHGPHAVHVLGVTASKALVGPVVTVGVCSLLAQGQVALAGCDIGFTAIGSK